MSRAFLYGGIMPDRVQPTGFTNVTKLSGHYTHTMETDPVTGRNSLVFDFPVDDLIVREVPASVGNKRQRARDEWRQQRQTPEIAQQSKKEVTSKTE
jgi:hypothetical protein